MPKLIIGQLTPHPHYTTKNVEFVFAKTSDTKNIDGRLYRRTEQKCCQKESHQVFHLTLSRILTTNTFCQQHAVLKTITETPLVLLTNSVTDPRTSLTYVMASPLEINHEQPESNSEDQ